MEKARPCDMPNPGAFRKAWQKTIRRAPTGVAITRRDRFIPLPVLGASISDDTAQVSMRSVTVFFN